MRSPPPFRIAPLPPTPASDVLTGRYKRWWHRSCWVSPQLLTSWTAPLRQVPNLANSCVDQHRHAAERRYTPPVLLRRSHPATVLAMLAPQMPQLTIFGICILAILVWSHYYEISVVRRRATCKRDLELLPGWLDDWPLMLWPLACIAWSYHAPPAGQAEANYFIAVGTAFTWRCHVTPMNVCRSRWQLHVCTAAPVSGHGLC